MMNCCVLVGRLAKVPEKRDSNNGKGFTTFTVVVDSTFKGENGKPAPVFLNCIAFGSTGEFISKYFTKGDMIGITGSLNQRKYTNKDGINVTSFEIIVDKPSFVGAKKDKSDTNDYNEIKANDNPSSKSNGESIDTSSTDSLDLSDDDLSF